MNNEEYKTITRYIYDSCGIAIGEGKEYLIAQRLEPVAMKFGCESLSAFSGILASRGFDSSLREKVVEAITTNETSFFRDIQLFNDFSTELLPQLVALAEERKIRLPPRRGSKIAIWSAASSTGQEAYSLAILISEYLASRSTTIVPQDFMITGTDISSEVLSQAMEGAYASHELSRGMTEERKERHFEQIGGKWIVKPHLREMVVFRQLNLMNNFSFLGGFDVIFCRNVLIYFDIESKRSILDQMHDMVSPNGTLVLGAVENMYGICDKFDSVTHGSTIFYKPTL